MNSVTKNEQFRYQFASARFFLLNKEKIIIKIRLQWKMCFTHYYIKILICRVECEDETNQRTLHAWASTWCLLFRRSRSGNIPREYSAQQSAQHACWYNSAICQRLWCKSKNAWLPSLSLRSIFFTHLTCWCFSVEKTLREFKTLTN